MGANAREFLMMRMEEENGELYVPTLPKKEVKAKAIEKANEIVNTGKVDLADTFADASRVMEYLTTLVGELKKHVTPEEYGKEYETKGCKISFRNTGDRLDYEQDEVYSELKAKLKDRENLLKTAYKSKDMIFDADGVEVPKVGIKTPSTETVVLTY
jgi:hypothetical protein